MLAWQGSVESRHYACRMKLTIVGCSGSFPGPQSPASCYLVEHDGAAIVLDMGNGSLGALQSAADIYAIDGVVLSHLHVDHFVDLTSYYVALKYRPDAPGPTVPVWGPSDTASRLVSAYGLRDSDMSGQFDVREISSEFQIGPFRITTAPMRHPVESRAIRVEAGGRSLTYSGDTGPHQGLADFARGSDVALFEASNRLADDNPPDLHLTGPQAAELSAQAGTERLVLTHLVPWFPADQILAEARTVRSDATLAQPGLSIDI